MDVSRHLNLQLHHAQLLHKALSELPQIGDVGVAHRQAFFRHLNYCYRFLLLELVDPHSVAAEQIQSAQQLVELLEAREISVPEINLLAARELDSDWLSAICAAVVPFVSAEDRAQSGSSGNTIEIRQVDDYQRDNMSLAECFKALEGLKASVRECRETAQEW